MKNGMKKLKSLLLIAMCVVLIAPTMCMNASAATKRQKAMAAYRKWLSGSKICVLKGGNMCVTSSGSFTTYRGTKASNVKFAIANIDDDGIPELILYTNRGKVGLYGILTYKNGKVCRVYSSDGQSKLLRYYKGTGIVFNRTFPDEDTSMCWEETYGKMNGSRLIKDAYRVFVNAPMGNLRMYNVNNKESDKKDFYSTLNKELRGTRGTQFKFYQNTAANRRARLR